MHDAVWFEIHGIPSLVIASSEFQEAATVQARALGLEDARRLFIDHPIQDATPAEMREKTDRILGQVMAILEGK